MVKIEEAIEEAYKSVDCGDERPFGAFLFAELNRKLNELKSFITGI